MSELHKGFTVRRTQNEIKVSGVIDEHADLTFFRTLSGPVRIDMSGVRRINSVGVRAWIEAVRAMPAAASGEVIKAPPPVVDQINMVAGFLGGLKLISFYAPLVCPECDSSRDVLLLTEHCADGFPTFKCDRCDKAMELDDVEEEYLAFIRDPT